MEEKSSKSYVLVVILFVLVVGLGGYIAYDKIIGDGKENEEVVNEKETVDYKIADYITIKDVEIDYKSGITCSTCTVEIKGKTIEFTDLPLGTTIEFLKLHKKFLAPTIPDGLVATFSNSIIYEVDNNILSIYTEEEYREEDWLYGMFWNRYSLNIDLNNKKIITNEELINIYGLNINTIYEKILNNIATTIKIEELSLNNLGICSEQTIKITDFAKNIPEYSEMLNNRYDIFTLYLKDNKVYCAYKIYDVIALLGMGTCGGMELAENEQTIVLN